MTLPTMILIVALLAAFWWLLRKRRETTEEEAKPSSERPGISTAYHAVSIKLAGNACTAAKEMSGRRFLANAAPRLPLPGCDVLECKCRFSHHSDRRSRKDRRSPFSSGIGGSGTGAYETEKREGRDRRRSDDQ